MGQAQKRKKELHRYINDVLCEGSTALSADLRWALEWLNARVCESAPLTIETSLISTLIVFTDGACNPEEGTGGVGGVFLSMVLVPHVSSSVKQCQLR